MTAATVPTLRWRVRRVITEFDDRGEIDSHAATCLRYATRARTATEPVALR